MRGAMRQLSMVDSAASAIDTVHERRSVLWEAYTTGGLIGTDEAVKSASAVLAYATEVDHLNIDFDIDHYDELIRRFISNARSNPPCPIP
jgi:hypothetical protein